MSQASLKHHGSYVTRPIKIALLVALLAAVPIELVNLFVSVSNFKGLTVDSSPLTRFLYYESEFMHWPTRFVPPLGSMNHIVFSITLTIFLLAVIGYVDTVILIMGVFYGIRVLTGKRLPRRA